MGYAFNGATRGINLTPGTTAVDVRDLYSRWKDWVRAEGSQWPPAFECVGGDEISPGVYITTYAFLANGWHVHPQEADHKLVVSGGVLLAGDGSDPIKPTAGAFNVMVQYSQPIKTETVSTAGATVDFDELLDMANGVEMGLTPRQALRLIAASAAGLLSGVEDLEPIFKAAVSGAKTRIAATTDDAGNRLTVVTDLD